MINVDFNIVFGMLMGPEKFALPVSIKRSKNVGPQHWQEPSSPYVYTRIRCVFVSVVLFVRVYSKFVQQFGREVLPYIV